MTPQTGHHYRLNTGHRAVCTYVGALTALYVLPATGEPLAIRIEPDDPDAIRIVEDLTPSDPAVAPWAEMWSLGLMVEWYGETSGVLFRYPGNFIASRSAPTRTDCMLRLLVHARAVG